MINMDVIEEGFNRYLEHLNKKIQKAKAYRYQCECSDDGFGQQLNNAIDAESNLLWSKRIAEEVLTNLQIFSTMHKED